MSIRRKSIAITRHLNMVVHDLVQRFIVDAIRAYVYHMLNLYYSFEVWQPKNKFGIINTSAID